MHGRPRLLRHRTDCYQGKNIKDHLTTGPWQMSSGPTRGDAAQNGVTNRHISNPTPTLLTTARPSTHQFPSPRNESLLIMWQCGFINLLPVFFFPT